MQVKISKKIFLDGNILFFFNVKIYQNGFTARHNFFKLYPTNFLNDWNEEA